MSEVIHEEILFFLVSVSTGVLILFAYDLLRAFRRVFAHHTVLLAIEDVLYWTTAGIVAFLVIFIENSGMLRGFSTMAMMMGMVLYRKSVSCYITAAISFIFNLIATIFHWIFHVFTFPLCFLIKKFKKNALKKLNYWVKSVKIKLCKDEELNEGKRGARGRQHVSQKERRVKSEKKKKTQKKPP